MNGLIRPQFELINRKTIKYPLQIAEEDYFLALAIQLVYDSFLSKKLIFKGGTAIHHCYLPQRRFSEDLDFTIKRFGSPRLY
jgi:predicted nucleotidyltransferase component of viral defense system